MKFKSFPVLLLLFLFSSSCKKNVPENFECEKSVVKVKNHTQETIYYAWGSTFLEDSIMPGETAVYNGGKVAVNYTRKGEQVNSTTYVLLLNYATGPGSPAGVYINVEQCEVNSTLLYSNGKGSIIRLYRD